MMLAKLILGLFFGTFCNADNNSLVYVVETPSNIHLTGSVGQGLQAFGNVLPDIVGESLEVTVKIAAAEAAGCYISELHLCNVPSVVYKPEDRAQEHVFYVPIRTVYDFVCAFEEDNFLVAGHVTICCPEDITLQAGSPQNRRQLTNGNKNGDCKFQYESYFELPLGCAEPTTTTTPVPLSTSTTSTTLPGR